jgi:2-methylisocitrate lyase-like PEP mutase family enzyme
MSKSESGTPSKLSDGITPSALEAFRKLHESGCFVIPNPWDIGSAKYLHHRGFKALATTSAGVAFSRGLPDGVKAMSRDSMISHIREIVTATPLPVNADFQSGYSADMEGLAANVALCVNTGVAGLSIEDATGESALPLYDRDMAVRRVQAARAAIDATGTPVILTARCEAYLVGYPDARRTVLDRLTAFADAGADCLYAPGIREPEMISDIVKAVAPKPINVLISSPAPGLTVSRLEDLGVRRISVGSALARVAWGAFMRAASQIAETGSFDGFAGAATFSELNALFSSRKEK